ncbi:hypothetical protein RRG08_008836 [Elysia crispata]|uniref:Uncharacterized protein n=1 Tax=Elysia crispata TaxID=231223 RepID=A0AAE1A8X5_9GAST|nr:hypothetical protein RRG08_008836 [Elysia crispata]
MEADNVMTNERQTAVHIPTAKCMHSHFLETHIPQRFGSFWVQLRTYQFRLTKNSGKSLEEKDLCDNGVVDTSRFRLNLELCVVQGMVTSDNSVLILARVYL